MMTGRLELWHPRWWGFQRVSRSNNWEDILEEVSSGWDTGQEKWQELDFRVISTLDLMPCVAESAEWFADVCILPRFCRLPFHCREDVYLESSSRVNDQVWNSGDCCWCSRPRPFNRRVSSPRGETGSGCSQWGKFKPQKREGRDTEERVQHSWLISLKSKSTFWIPMEAPRVPKVSGTGILVHQPPSPNADRNVLTEGHLPTPQQEYLALWIILEIFPNCFYPGHLILPFISSVRPGRQVWLVQLGKKGTDSQRQITHQGLWLINGQDESVTQLSDKIQLFYWMYSGFYFPSMKYVKHISKFLQVNSLQHGWKSHLPIY